MTDTTKAAGGVPTDEPASGAGWRRDGRYLVIVGAEAMTAGLVLPALPFLGTELGAGPFAIGLLFAASAVASFLCTPIWGALTDRFPIKNLMLVALVIGVIGNILFAAASVLWVLLVSRLVAGAGAANLLLVEAHVGATSSADDRAASFGRIGAMQAFGGITGPIVGALVVRQSTGLVGGVSACILALTAVLVVTLVPHNSAAGAQKEVLTPARAVRNLVSAATNRGTRSLLVTTFFAWSAFAGFAAVFPVFLERDFDISASAYSSLMVVSGVVAITVRGFLIGRLTGALGERWMIVAGATVIGVAMVWTTLLPSLALAPSVPFLWAVGASCMFPCLMSLAVAGASGSSIGPLVAAFSMVSTLGTVAGPITLGVVGQIWGAGAPLLVGGAVSLAVGASALRLGRAAPPTEPA